MRTLVIFMLMIAFGGVGMAEEQPVNRREFRRRIEQLHEELLRLRRQIEQFSGKTGTVRPVPDFDALQQANADGLLQPLREAIADLALSANRLQKRDEPAPPDKTHRHTVAASGETYRIHAPDAVHNRSVSIANIGRDIAVNPRLIANGKRNWHSTPDILAEILTPDMSDRDKALAIWRFLVENRYHGYPAHNDIEMHDPVRFLNAYGYGFCDDAATSFMVLAERAGIRARVWGLSGHVVPEAFFEGDWRMLDPDGEIYYLEDDGHHIAGVKTLEQRPDIIRKYPSPFYTDAEKLVAIYTTTEDNAISEWYRETSESAHAMGFVLRPGESLARHHDNWGLYFSSRYLAEPRRYGNGTFVFEPVFEGDIFKKGAESVRQLRAERADTSWALTTGDREGELIYRFASPYPFLDGSVRIAGKGRMVLSFSETGDAWTDIWSSDTGNAATVPVGGYFRNGHGRPTYVYFLKLALTGQVTQLRFQSDIQVAPHSLPALEAGDNAIRYVDDTPGERQVRLAFGYDLKPQP